MRTHIYFHYINFKRFFNSYIKKTLKKINQLLADIERKGKSNAGIIGSSLIMTHLVIARLDRAILCTQGIPASERGNDREMTVCSAGMTMGGLFTPVTTGTKRELYHRTER